jgi:hypothetical protein
LHRFCANLQKSDASAQARALPHIPKSFGESIRERIVVAGLAVIRPTASSEVAGRTRALQTIVTVELQLGVRAAGYAS